MLLDPNTMREQVTLQAPGVTQDALGARVESWADVATVWAQVTPLRSREWFAAAAAQSSVEMRVRIWWRDDIVHGMRLLWRGKPFDIVGEPIDVQAQRRVLELMCASGVRSG